MKFFLSLGLSLFMSNAFAEIHPGFVSLSEVCPTILIEASYAGEVNFTGKVVSGYKAQKSYLARASAEALCKAQQDALKRGLSLKVFDGYRPVKAVKWFQEWATLPETNLELKKLYYPKFTRQELFNLGYIASESSHSRGSAVDLTLYDLKNEKDLDMGSAFDYFDVISHTDSRLIKPSQRKNRQLLKTLMGRHGFINYSKEWWHYSFKPEPFPNQAFDFDIE